jgi:hypothetical protein
MPIAECGFGFGPLAVGQLVQFGPTIRVDIGFNPAVLSAMGGVGALAAPSPPGPLQPAPAVGSPASPALPAPLIPPTVPTGPTGPNLQPSLVQNVPALIDTGAQLSCIDEALAQQLQLPLINQTTSGGVHGQGLLNVYLGFIGIPLLGTMQIGAFIGAVMSGQMHRALIGRTFLTDMLLVYDGRTGAVKLAY